MEHDNTERPHSEIALRTPVAGRRPLRMSGIRGGGQLQNAAGWGAQELLQGGGVRATRHGLASTIYLMLVQNRVSQAH